MGLWEGWNPRTPAAATASCCLYWGLHVFSCSLQGCVCICVCTLWPCPRYNGSQLWDTAFAMQALLDGGACVCAPEVALSPLVPKHDAGPSTWKQVHAGVGGRGAEGRCNLLVR